MTLEFDLNTLHTILDNFRSEENYYQMRINTEEGKKLHQAILKTIGELREILMRYNHTRDGKRKDYKLVFYLDK